MANTIGKVNFQIGFSANKTDLKELQSALEMISVKAKLPNNSLDTELQKAATTARQLSDILDRSFNKDLGTLNVAKFNQELVRSNLNLQTIQSDFAKVGVQGSLAYNTIASNILKANVQIKESNKLLDKMAVTMANTVRFGISSRIFNDAAKAIQKSYNYCLDLNESLTDIRIVSGQSADQMAEFAVQANQAAKSLGASTLDYTEASLIYYQQGLDAQEVQERTDITLKMANALGTSSQEVSNYMTAIWNNFDDGSKSLEYYGDVLVKLGAATASSSEEIAQGLDKFAAVGDTVGLSYEYATTALATVVAETRQSADTVGTAFKTLFARIQDLELGDTLEDGTTLGKYSQALEAVGINIKDQNGNLKKMDDILNEMGTKWQTLSKDSQVALAQTVAGTRQYTQLIALMDKWDVFNENLETARNATGELDKQQSIFLEGTEAKLNKLKATWEDLYSGLGKDDEIGGFIGILTDGVQAMDNFIDSFGGGIKSIAAFGAIMANVFNKQISGAIDNFVKNRQKLSQNEDLLRAKQSAIELGSSGLSNKPTFVAEKAGLEAQIPYAHQIDTIHKSISNEQYNELTNIQGQIGELAKEAKLVEQTALKEAEKAGLKREQLKDTEALTSELDTQLSVMEREARATSLITNVIDKQTKALKNSSNLTDSKDQSKNNDNIADLVDNLETLSDRIKYIKETTQDISSDDKKKLNNIVSRINLERKNLKNNEEYLDTNEKVFKVQDKILNITKDINDFEQQGIKNAKEKINATENYQNEMEKSYTLGDQAALLDAEFARQLELAQQAVSIGNQVSVITSSLSSVVTAWSLVNSLMQTWNDDSYSTTDKWLQTLMTIGTIIPTIISVYTQLKNVQTAINLVKERNNALEVIALALTKENIKGKTEEQIIDEYIKRAKEQNLMVSRNEATQIAINTGLIKSETNAKIAGTAASKTATSATNRLTAAMKKNPLFWGLMAISAVIGIISGVTSAIEQQKEATIEANEATIQREEQVQQEKEANIKLYNSYLDTYAAYKEGTKTKEDMKSVTAELTELLGGEAIAVANLTGNYEDLTDKILEARKAEAQEKYKSAITEKDAAGDNALKQAELKWGIKPGEDDWSQYHVAIKGPKIEGTEQKVADIFNNEGFYRQNALNSNFINDYDVETADDLVNIYEDLINIRDNIRETLSEEDYSDSKLYTNLISQITKLEPLVTKYQEANQNLFNSALEKQRYEQGIDSVDNLKDFVEKRQAIINQLKEDPNIGLSDEKIEEQVKDYLSTANDKLSQYSAKLNIFDTLNFKDEQVSEKLREYLDSLPSEETTILMTMEIDENTSLEDLDNYVKKAQLEADQKQVKINITTARDAYTELSKGTKFSELDKEQQKALNDLEEEYIELQIIQDKNSDEYLDKLQQIREEEEKRNEEISEQLASQHEVYDVIQDMEDSESLASGIETIVDKAGEITGKGWTVDLIPDDSELRDTLEDYAKENYSIVVDIEADVQDDFDDITNKMSKIEDAANMIGENFIVAKEDIEELNDVFPGITQNIKFLKDGSAQLSEAVVKNAVTSAESTVEADKQATVEKLQIQKEELLGKAQAAQNIANIARAQTDGEKASARDVSEIKKNLKILDTQNAGEGAKQEAKAQADMANSASKSANTMSKNYATALNKMISNSAIAARQMKQNLNAGMTGTGSITSKLLSGAVGGIKATAEGIGNKFKNLFSSAFSGFKSSSSIDNTTQWSEVANYYENLSKAYSNAANNTQGKIDEILARNSSLDKILANARSGKGGSSSSKGSSRSEKEAKTEDLIEDELDRYHDINIILQQISTTLDRLQEQQDKLFGQDLVDNLNKQLQQLNKQIDATKTKITIAQGESAELRGKLSNYGVSFNDDGTISNYTAAYESQLAQVNSIIAAYNSMNAASQESYKNIVDNAKDSFKSFTDLISDYDKLITETIPDLEDNIQEAINKQIEINIEKFNMEIEIRLDMAEAERDWNDFKKKIIDGIKDDDILGTAKADLEDFYSYYNSNNNGIIQANTRHVNDILTQLKQMDNTGWSDVYGDDRVSALEDLKTYYEQLMKDLEGVDDLVTQIEESYIDMLDEASEKISDQQKIYEQISDIIQHDMKVIQLVYGEQSYSQLESYYKAQEDNYNKQLAFQKEQITFWEQQMSILDEGSEAWKTAKEEWMDAVTEWNNLVEQAIENLQDKYLNSINNIFSNINSSLTNGKGLDYINEEWDLINKNADGYLDTINAMYSIQSLENKYLDALDNTDSISAQRKLKAIMEDEIGYLKEQDKLSQYDLDRAELKYQIALKQMELQESQQNKSQMRLRRDSQGNYSYQYVADQSQISKLSQELSDLYNQLYNFDKDAYESNLQNIYDIWKEYQEKMTEAAQINDPEERSQRELLIAQQYGELINNLTAQNENIRNSLYQSSIVSMMDSYNQNLVNYENMTAEQQKLIDEFNNNLEDTSNAAFDHLFGLYEENENNYASMMDNNSSILSSYIDDMRDSIMNGLVGAWNSGVQDMAKNFADASKDNSLVSMVLKAYNEIQNATKEYEDGLKNLQNTSGTVFDDVSKGLDTSIDKTSQLTDVTTGFIDTTKEELNELYGVINSLKDLTAAYDNAKKSAEDAATAAYKYWAAANNSAANAASNSISSSTHSYNTNSSSSNNNSGGGVAGGGGYSSQGNGSLDVGDTATYSGRYYYTSYGGSPTGTRYSGVANGIVIDRITSNPYGIHIRSADGRYRDLGWVKRSQLTGYDTGGYTGEWNDGSGKLALLHSKELVLNADDTTNMLNAIKIVDKIVSSIPTSALSKIVSLNDFSKGLMMNNNPEGVLQQDVKIEANFPNVRSSQEIENAINNLVNIAAQRIHSK